MAFEAEYSLYPSQYGELEVGLWLGDVLDRYANLQENFFVACRNYAHNFSRQSYEEVESATFDLEFGLTAAIHAIAARQPHPIPKVHMAHGFVIATDALRTELFRELVPSTEFSALGEQIDWSLHDRHLVEWVNEHGDIALITNLSEVAIKCLSGDVAEFGEAVAVS